MLQEKLQIGSFSCDMNVVAAAERVRELAQVQRGVFSTVDLRVLMAEPHPAAFTRRVRALEEAGVLRRFSRGMYVREDFDLATLSQRLAPDSYVSFGNALARRLVIGTRPERQMLAAKPGRAHSYRGLGYEVVHVQVAPHLDFGYSIEDGVRWADAEKATLDTLNFHLRGRRYPFDIYSDIDPTRLDRPRLEAYLERYRNPRFVAFARGVLALT
jgi:predicted transcriptional regulator of viral defense system